MDSNGVLRMVYGLEHHHITPSPGTTAERLRAGEGRRHRFSGDEMASAAPSLRWARMASFMSSGWTVGTRVKTHVRHSRSVDGGKSFEPLKALSSIQRGWGHGRCRCPSNVVSFWHVMADPKPEAKSATWLYTARSTDNGASFHHDEKVEISNLSSLACSMCMMRARLVWMEMFTSPSAAPRTTSATSSSQGADNAESVQRISRECRRLEN